MFPMETYDKLKKAKALNKMLMQYKAPVYLKDFVDVLSFWRMNKERFPNAALAAASSASIL